MERHYDDYAFEPMEDMIDEGISQQEALDAVAKMMDEEDEAIAMYGNHHI